MAFGQPRQVISLRISTSPGIEKTLQTVLFARSLFSQNMLVLFHTAQSNAELFDALLKQIAPDVPVQHIVDEAILREARAAGAVTDTMITRVDTTMSQVISHDSFVLCTCSTIGGLAEQTSERVLRVDRPMAERAVSLGPRILVAATLQSTLEPTRALLMDVACAMNRPIHLTELFIESAWPYFESRDKDGYAREIARCVEDAVTRNSYDAVVLAQASMHEAEALCAHLPVPVFSSPRLGLEAALKKYRNRARNLSDK